MSIPGVTFLQLSTVRDQQTIIYLGPLWTPVRLESVKAQLEQVVDGLVCAIVTEPGAPLYGESELRTVAEKLKGS